MKVLRWLMEGDPAIRWQALRDLADAPADVVAAERARVATEGWGAQLLALQGPNGSWGGPDDEGWMSTLFGLLLLRSMGLDPASPAAQRAIGRIREGVTWWQLDGRPFFDGETEPCINGGILCAGSYFGEPSARLVERLLGEQLADGGWNCEAPRSVRSSFHTTICVLEGLLAYEQARGPATAVTEARLRGQEYLLERHLLRSARTGEIIDRRWTRFCFPPRWRYDLLRGLDHLRLAGGPPDPRCAEAVGIVAQRRHQNGRWPMALVHRKRIPLETEGAIGRASRWNTLRALRVLRWADPSGASD